MSTTQPGYRNNELRATRYLRNLVIAPEDLADAAELQANAAEGNQFNVTLGGNRTMLAPLYPDDGQNIIFRITQDGTGSRTITWNAVFRFADGEPVTLTTTAGKTDYIVFKYNATAAKWDCVGVALNL